MKRKSFKPKIKPFKGSTIVTNGSYDQSDLLEFIRGMGYLVYESPLDENVLVISDKVLTFGAFKKLSKRFEFDLKWWNDETDYNDRLHEELNEFLS
jgi:hypothetical protein